jgi:hypothetical protein
LTQPGFGSSTATLGYTYDGSNRLSLTNDPADPQELRDDGTPRRNMDPGAADHGCDANGNRQSAHPSAETVASTP